MAAERSTLAGAARTSWVEQCLGGTAGPIVAASDYVRAVADLVRPYVPADRRYIALGTDGFGRSDTRAALREFFEVDRKAIVRAALAGLGRRAAAQADRPPPWKA
jgi:pyruvate dehydrogenase E1 component